MDALISREDKHSKVILPVWHSISKSAISKYSILLADKLAVSTEKGIEFVANEIHKAVAKELSRKGVLISAYEINSILEAIGYYQSRNGNFQRNDPINNICNNLKQNRKGVKTSLFNYEHLELLLKIIDENIEYLHKYQYTGLPNKFSFDRKHKILSQFIQIRKKLTTALI